MKLLILSLILIQSVFANANACRQVVSQLSFSSVDLSDYAYKPLKVSSVTVYADTVANSVEIRSSGMGWRSDFAPDNTNLQGDPRNLIILLGDQSAKNFGMHLVNEDLLIAPNARNMTNQILAANRFLKSQSEELIMARFYDSKTDQPVQRFDYLYASMLNKYPMASGGHFLVHDIAFHLGSILLPKVIFNHMNSKTKHYISFFTQLENLSRDYPHSIKNIIFNTGEKFLKKHEVRIDITVGNISSVTVERLIGVKNLDHLKRYEDLVLGPMKADTTDTYIRNWTTELLGRMDDIYYSFNRPEHMNDNDYSKIKNQILDFMEKYLSEIPFNDQLPLDISAQELVSFIDQRRHALSNWDGQ